jgi:uncharacterized protein (TIGR00369 family)
LTAHPTDGPESPPTPGPDPSGMHFLDLLGIKPVERERGRGRVELVVSAPHLRTHGIAHGGVVATLLDTVMGMSAGTLAPEKFDVVTIQLNINYIRPAWLGEMLSAVGEVRHSGRRTAVARGEVLTAGGLLVASGTATFMFVAPADFVPGGSSPG